MVRKIDPIAQERVKGIKGIPGRIIAINRRVIVTICFSGGNYAISNSGYVHLLPSFGLLYNL